MRYVREIVDSVAVALEAAETDEQAQAILMHVSSGEYNRDFYFWPAVFNKTGYYVACGRDEDVPSGIRAGSSLLGEELQQIADTETGTSQPSLWERIEAAASSDGYFLHLALSGYPGHKRAFHRDATGAVPRIGFVRAIAQGGSGRRLYVVSSFSDVPLSVSHQICDWHYDGACSIEYAQRIVGIVASKMLRAESEAELQQVFFAVSAREYNELDTHDAGFYPFVIAFDGTYMGHGANPGLTGSNVAFTVANVPYLAGVTSPQLNAEMVAAAQAGGQWIAYRWRNDADGPVYPKISFVVGVQRFGKHYYVGVGFNHVQTPLARGPHCAACKLNYNYPCAFSNTQSLFSHVHALMLMGNWYSLQETFDILTNSRDYGGGGSADRASSSSADWLYAFAFDFNGTCAAHGAVSSLVGRTLEDIVASSETLSKVINGRILHERFVEAARNGGGWVSYEWKNGDEPPFKKLAFVESIKSSGRRFYVGVGLGDRDWTERLATLNAEGGGTSRWGWGCSLDAQHPCSEDWALAIAGHHLSALLSATTHSELMTTFEMESVGQFGFAAHVQNSTHVLFDGHDPSFSGLSRSEWLRTTGLADSDMLGHEPTGSWVGPLTMRLTRGGSLSPRYLFYLSVPISDVVSDGIVDGISDRYVILIAVSAISGTSGEPMMSTAPLLGARATSCLARQSSMVLSGANAEDRIKCVDSWEAISQHEYAYCEGNGVCGRSTNRFAAGCLRSPLTLLIPPF